MSGRSTRSNTCRASRLRAISGAKSARQCRQWDASCRTIRSGSATRLSVSPLWPFCPPLGLPDASRRLPAMRGFFVKPVARRRLRTGRTVLAQAALQFRDLRPQRRDLRPQRRNQLLGFARKNHPYVDSHPTRPVSQNPPLKSAFKQTVTNPTHKPPGLGSYAPFQRSLPARFISRRETRSFRGGRLKSLK